MPLDPKRRPPASVETLTGVDGNEADDAIIVGPRGVLADSAVTVATVGLLHRVAEREVASVGPTTLRTLGI
jgi:hypothetical protein